jgi:hypothetical protein
MRLNLDSKTAVGSPVNVETLTVWQDHQVMF